MVNILLVRSYANNIYWTGKNSFANISATRHEYVEPVKEHAAKSYYIEDIDSSLTKGYITPQEHADTLALKQPGDPQHRPPIELLRVEEMM